jgi:uncharacterized iron-regulated membrane protein
MRPSGLEIDVGQTIPTPGLAGVMGMTTVLVTLAGVGALVAAVVGYVAWRDRRRLSSDDDPGVMRAARAESHRRAAEREHAQSDGWNRGGHGFTG